MSKVKPSMHAKVTQNWVLKQIIENMDCNNQEVGPTITMVLDNDEEDNDVEEVVIEGVAYVITPVITRIQR